MNLEGAQSELRVGLQEVANRTDLGVQAERLRADTATVHVLGHRSSLCTSTATNGGANRCREHATAPRPYELSGKSIGLAFAAIRETNRNIDGKHIEAE